MNPYGPRSGSGSVLHEPLRAAFWHVSFMNPYGQVSDSGSVFHEPLAGSVLAREFQDPPSGLVWLCFRVSCTPAGSVLAREFRGPPSGLVWLWFKVNYMTMRKSAGVKAAAEEDARGEAAADEGRKAEKDGRHEGSKRLLRKMSQSEVR
jgi:hypothetical protein